MDEDHAHEFQSRARRAGRTQTSQDERERPTKQQRTAAPKSMPPNRRRHEQTAPMGGCYFLPFFLLALLAAGGSRLSSERLRLSSRRCRLHFTSSSWAFKLSTQANRHIETDPNVRPFSLEMTSLQGFRYCNPLVHEPMNSSINRAWKIMKHTTIH